MGGCVTPHPPKPLTWQTASGCTTSSASIAFDFDTAPNAACAILGERQFAILVAPEHAPPINPSPWYAFRYRTTGAGGISVRLDYVGGRHRYAPKLVRGAAISPLRANVADDRSSASIDLPGGEGLVAGQEIFASDRYDQLMERLAKSPRVEQLDLGRSLDGRPIMALRMGDPAAPGLVVLLGRQHPPEVTGAIAMEAFLIELAERVEADRFADGRLQFLVVPQLNPDGVARGHWRANRGGKDLNRDWGEFSQPETRAVKAWLDALPTGVRPVAMLDFHSTNRSLFYVQDEAETDEREERFLAGWLGAHKDRFVDYPFRIERRNANPGLGTAKNWFHQTYDVPAYSYEVGDQTDREAIRTSAGSLARTYLDRLKELIAPGG